MRVLSLGWGVQSFTLAAMSALGELEPVDFAIHADTLHESQLTYQFIDRWSPWFEEHNLAIKTVKNPTGDIFEILKKPGQTQVPFFTLDRRGNQGQLNRSCTQRWKIAPMRTAIRRYLRETYQIKNPRPGMIEQWIGISLDEFQRMKDSDVKYITHRWPLIEKKMTRADCAAWLRSHDLEVPPKSACTFCPFHNTSEWRRIQGNDADWAEAVAVDRAFRNVRNGHRTNSEPCLLSTRGSMPVAVHDERNFIISPIREHSRKPDEQYEKIERIYPNARKLELFARRRRPGWDVFGNQVEGSIRLPTKREPDSLQAGAICPQS